MERAERQGGNDMEWKGWMETCTQRQKWRENGRNMRVRTVEKWIHIVKYIFWFISMYPKYMKLQGKGVFVDELFDTTFTSQ